MDSPGKNDENTTKGGVECTICLSSDATEIGLLRCKHSFCFECIESWSEHENSCPLCKVRFTYIDKIARGDMQAEGAAKGRRSKHTRVKIKRKNQADHEPAYGGHGHEGGVDIWANFIASLVGTGNHQLQQFRNNFTFNIGGGFGPFMEDEEDAPARYNRGRRRTLGREGVPRGMRAATLSTANRASSASGSVLPPRRTLQAPRSSGGSANNPILLSDDEEVLRPAPTNTSSRTQSVPDLVDLTDDADILPSASRAPARGAPSALSALPVTTVLDDDAGGLYNSEEDEDFDPSILDFDEDEEDNSDASTVDSDGESGENEVIELSDSDSDASDRDDAVAPLVGMPAHRLSGVMVWCRDCDSFHDKQRVWDDRNYCRATYDSLMMTDGFADIVRDGPAPPAPSHALVPAAAAVQVTAPVPESAESAVGSTVAPVSGLARAPVLLAVDMDEDAEWDGGDIVPRPSERAAHGAGRIDPDDEVEWDEEDFIARTTRTPRKVPRRVTSDEEEEKVGGADSSMEVVTEKNELPDGSKKEEAPEASGLAARTQSDATTCSSRSRATVASSVDMGGSLMGECADSRKRSVEPVNEDSPSKRTRSSSK